MFAVNIYAQSDSVFLKEKEIIDKYMEDFDHSIMEVDPWKTPIFNGADISRKKYKNDSIMQMKILDYLISYLKDTSNLYIYTKKACFNIEGLGGNSRFKSVRQKALDYILKYWNYPRLNHLSIADYKPSDCTPYAKKRIKELIASKYTEEEIKILYDYKRRYIEQIWRYDLSEGSEKGRTKRAMNKTGKSRKEVIDSIAECKANIYMQDFKLVRNYNARIVYWAGFYYIKEFIPQIIKATQDYCSETGKLALARLGEKSYLDAFIDSISKIQLSENNYDDVFNNLLYVAQPECGDVFAKWLFSDLKYYPFSDSEVGVPIGHVIVWILDGFIPERPDDLKYLSDKDPALGYCSILPPSLPEDIKPDLLKKNAKWLKENKGKYKVINDYLGGWFNPRYRPDQKPF